MIDEWWEIITPGERWIGKVSAITDTEVTIVNARYRSRLTEQVRDLGRETFPINPRTFVLTEIESYVVLEASPEPEP